MESKAITAAELEALFLEKSILDNLFRETPFMKYARAKYPDPPLPPRYGPITGHYLDKFKKQP
jgi:hypothetical protein